MKLQKITAYVGLVAGSVLALSSTPAQAFSFNSGSDLGSCSAVPLEKLGNDQASTGPSSCETADGFLLEAGDGGKLTTKEVNGVKATGVYLHSSKDGKGSQQEIDHGETLTLSLLKGPSILKSLDLAFLYKEGNTTVAFGDKVNEIAQITAGGITGTLKVLSDTTAEWKWGVIEQTLTALSPSNSTGGGWYSIANPFGDLKVDKVVFTSPAETGGTSYHYSDYALVGATVPEPATIAGLGLVAGALFTARRRKSRNAG
jgi:hypothetical protein